MISKDASLKVLRDPIWQFVGAVLALVGIWATVSSTSKANTTLAIYPWWKLEFEQYRLPTDKIRLVLQGSNEEISGAVVDYFIVANPSDKPILASDVSEPLTLTKGADTQKIYLVSSCGEFPGQAPPQTRVALNWSESGEKWSAQPALLNPEDYACVTIISQPASGKRDVQATHRFQWNARIVNVSVRIFENSEEYANSLPKNFWAFFSAEINMGGFTPYWFAATQMLLLVATLALARAAGWIAGLRGADVAKVVLVVIVATGTAESLTSLFTLRLANLHPVVFAFCAIQLGLVVWLRRRSVRKGSSADLKPGT